MKSERLICNSVQPVNHNAQKKKIFILEEEEGFFHCHWFSILILFLTIKV